MPKAFKNQLKESYFIKSKQTKTGKTTYFITKKQDETCLDALPEGYEVFEKYDTRMMYIRKTLPNQFTADEMKTIERELKKNKSLSDFKLDIHGNEMKIYVAEKDDDNPLLRLMGFGFKNFAERMKIIRNGIGEKKSFEIMRFCYRGAIDDWITIGWGFELKELATENLVHLGKESYYGLY